MYEHRDDIQPQHSQPPDQPDQPTAPADRVQRALMVGLVAAVLVALLAFVPGVLFADDDDGERVRAASVPVITATTEPASVLPGTPLDTVPSTAPSGVVTPVDSPPRLATGATTTTAAAPPAAEPTPAPACRNSFEPHCGPFRWDPSPGPNEPMEVAVTAPQEVTAGQTVNFTVVATDADSRIDRECILIDWGDGQTATDGPCPPAPACQAPTGPWTPPAKAGDRDERVLSHTYTAPRDDYVATFRFQSQPSCEPNPYGGVASGVGHVRVIPAA